MTAQALAASRGRRHFCRDTASRAERRSLNSLMPVPAPVTYDHFRLLSPRAQLYWALYYGTYLAQRWEETPVNLYHVASQGRGFFVEVSIREQPLVLRSFVSSGPLEKYGHCVRLPEF